MEPKTGKYKFIDLFSGIGGFRLALEALGHECIFSCEIDKYARKTYEVNFPATFNHPFPEDIREVTDLPACDLITAGFPCQDFSGVGRGAGLAGSRGALFWDLARVIDLSKPSYFLLENVPRLKQGKLRPDFDLICKTLTGLGYHLEVAELNARHFLPQDRNRLFFIGSKKPLPLKLLSPLSKNSRLRLKDIMEDEVDEKHFISEERYQKFKSAAAEKKDKGWGFMSNFERLLKPESDIAHAILSVYPRKGSSFFMIRAGDRIRGITPRECARLMGFPDSFKIVVSDTQAYRQFGNAVCPPVIEYIVRNYLMS